MHDARAHAGEFQHLVVTDRIHLARFGYEPRIGRINAIHVGINLAKIRSQSGCKRDGSQIRAATAQPALRRHPGRRVLLRPQPVRPAVDLRTALTSPIEERTR